MRVPERVAAETMILACLLVLLLATAANAQDTVPLCRASLACLQQMVDDLRQYRQYLEDQLSLAKSLLNDANHRIAQQAQEMEKFKAEAPATKTLPSAPK